MVRRMVLRMAATPYVLWGDQRQWPLSPPGFLFIVPAFNRIGRAMKGAAWDDQYPSFAFVPTPPASPKEASAEMREYAHYELMEAMGDDYHDDWAPLGGGGGGLGTLGTLAGIGSPSALDSLGSPQAGYRFNQMQWERFRDIVRARNSSVRDFIAMTMPPANWLYDMVATRRLSPFLLRRSGGNWHKGDPDDWMMPTLDQLRERIRQATMTPGNASSPAGSHYIFFQEAELDEALKDIDPPTSALPGTMLASTAPDRPRPVPSARAINIITPMLEADPGVTKQAMIEAINKAGWPVSDRQARDFIKTARESLGLDPKGQPGRRKQAPE